MALGQEKDQEPEQIGEEVDLDIQTQELLLAASQHDLTKLQELLKTIPATVQDEETGYTPLHAAIAACVEDEGNDDDHKVNGINGQSADAHGAENVELAEQTLRLLFENGAIWNDLDANNETPGCLARRLGLQSLYNMMVDAGVRAELLMNRLDGFMPLYDDEDEEEEEDEVEMEAVENINGTNNVQEAPIIQLNGTAVSGDESTETQNYLHSDLTFQDDKLIDSSNNGVMMEWESNIMRQSADLLLPEPGLSVLNIGHGMGIIDTLLQEKSPSHHHIIEAHPQVLAQMLDNGWRSSDEATTTSTKHNNVTVHAGRWQDILPQLVLAGTTFDAIYFDTFAEDYKAFRNFFEEFVIGLLKPQGRWSFFNGLGADRQVCYDVYTKVVEMDLFEAGFEVEWREVDTIEAEREGEWDGVRRRYWALDKYRLPLCRFVS